jgi:hypothetical protein
VIVLEAKSEDPLEGREGPDPIAQLEEDFTEAGQAVFVIRLETERALVAPAGPGVVLPGEVGLCFTDVEFNSLRVVGKTQFQHGECFFVATFVVELVGFLVKVVGAQKTTRHRRPFRGVITS